MKYRLVAIAGKYKGAAWLLDERGIILGRDELCDISLQDSIVSRKHCKVSVIKGEVSLTDLGSRNPALVNGTPVHGRILVSGDVIALGSHQFLVSREQKGMAAERREPDRLDTKSWSDGEALYLPLDHPGNIIPDRPCTIQDLAYLYEGARELAICDSMETLMDALARRIRERFNPTSMWLALVHGQEELTFHGPGSEEHIAQAPVKLIRASIKARKGILSPGQELRGRKRVKTITLVAPVVMSSMMLGAIAIRGEIPAIFFDEEDLRLLLLLSQSFAPILCAVRTAVQLRRDNERLRSQAGESKMLLGVSRAIRLVRTQIIEAAQMPLNILICGDTGTGKELAARLLHAQSNRRNEPLVTVNCAAIPTELFESEFFGFEKGAFTGAERIRKGLLEQANGGILFLDEVADLSLDNQGRILRAVESGTFRRIGANHELCVNIRIISATNKDLVSAMEQGLFRRDLYHRLNMLTIHMPPLRERPSDIPVLAEHFFRLVRGQAKRPLSGIQPDAMQRLMAHSWPGNVRELRNCIFRAIHYAQEGHITVANIADSIGHTMFTDPVSLSGNLSMSEMERRHIIKVLRGCNDSIKDAARILGISRSTLYVKLAEYNIR